MQKNTLLIGVAVLFLAMIACNFTAAPVSPPTPGQIEQATQVASQVETRVAELSADQSATRAVEDAVATAVAAMTAEATHTATPTPTVPAPVIEPTLASTNPPLPTNPPPPANTANPPTHTAIPPTHTPPPPTPIPATATPQVINQTVIVRESDTNVDALYLLPGDQVTISASGEIWSGVAFTGTNGPDGWDSTDCDPKFPLPCVHPFSLLYRANGPYVESGSWSQFTHTGSATVLTLRINDDAPGNGSGSFTVTVTVVR